MRVVGYTRVSTVEQARGGVSLEMQRSKIELYARLEPEMELVEVISDPGLSGSSIQGRPGIQRVLELVRTKQIDAVVVFKLDRLSRSTIDMLEMAKFMDRHKVALHSISEKLDTASAIGKFFFTLLSALAEMERQVTRERILTVFNHKRERHEPLNGNPEYGYEIIGNKVVPSLGEQKVIRRVRALRSRGLTLDAIGTVLTKEGKLNRKNKPFARTQIYNILTRKVA
ncbi:MAG: recombinase family protein [Desulfomonilaceae bacterium]